MNRVTRISTAALLLLMMALAGCGYHVAGKSTRLPADVHVLAVPMFVNQTQTYRVEGRLPRMRWLSRPRSRNMTPA